jgi:cell division protein FtsQ
MALVDDSVADVGHDEPLIPAPAPPKPAPGPRRAPSGPPAPAAPRDLGAVKPERLGGAAPVALRDATPAIGDAATVKPLPRPKTAYRSAGIQRDAEGPRQPPGIAPIEAARADPAAVGAARRAAGGKRPGLVQIFGVGGERPHGHSLRRRVLIVASLAGVLVYASATGFGRHARVAVPLGEQIDRALVAVGLGINEIVVNGHRRTLESEVFRALGPLKGSLVGLDTGAARQRIEALAWVESAAVNRVLPDKIRIDIREREPFAIWREGGNRHLVDRTGRRLALLGSEVPAGLVQIGGDGAAESAAALMSEVRRYPEIERQLRMAHRIGDRRWDLELVDGQRIRLPEHGLAAALGRLDRIGRETGLLAESRAVIDLRREDRIAIGRSAASGAGADARNSGPRGVPGKL